MWKPEFSYVKGAYKDTDDKRFLFKKKDKQPSGGLAKPIGPVTGIKGIKAL
jgi:hypothetical protein